MLRVVIFQSSFSRLCNILYTTTVKLLGLLLPKMLHSGLQPNSTKRTSSSRADGSLARQEIAEDSHSGWWTVENFYANTEYTFLKTRYVGIGSLKVMFIPCINIVYGRICLKIS